MGLLIKISLFLLLSGLAPYINGSVTQAQVPNRGVQRLESMARVLSKQTLTDDDRKTLVAEIARAAIYSARTTEDENANLPGSYLVKLFETNFPDVLKRTHNGILTLADMLRYFHSLAVYRPVIDEVLKGAKANDICKK